MSIRTVAFAFAATALALFASLAASPLAALAEQDWE